MKLITKLFFKKSLSGNMYIEVVPLCLLKPVIESKGTDDFETASLDVLYTADSVSEM